MPEAEGKREALILERDALQVEIQYRRDRRTGIFTWAQSVLIAVTGVVVTLQVQGERPITVSQQVVLSLAVLVLGAYSSLWWDDQRRSGSALQQRQRVVDKELGFIIPRDDSRRSRMVGGMLSIGLLTMVALLAIWLPLSGVG